MEALEVHAEIREPGKSRNYLHVSLLGIQSIKVTENKVSDCQFFFR